MSIFSRSMLGIVSVVLGLSVAMADSTDEATLVHQAEVKLAQADSNSGEALYLQHCAACHQPSGEGLSGAFPR